VARGETTVEELERVLGMVPVREVRANEVGPVLLVDDDPTDNLVLTTVLTKMGFEIVEAPNGLNAMNMIRAGDEAFSMVLMDLFMPEMDGKDLIRAIRQQLSTQALPVVVLTASEDPRDELELLEAGADDFLLKPIVAERLEARVRAVLRRSGVQIQ
jgi:DNA-binding response OmpR family regulator